MKQAEVGAYYRIGQRLRQIPELLNKSEEEMTDLVANGHYVFIDVEYLITAGLMCLFKAHL